MIRHKPRVMIGSRGGRGGRSRTSPSPSPAASAKAGNTSVTRLRKRICRGSNGSGRPTTMARATTSTSARLHDSRYTENRRMLSKITLPSRAALTIVSKRSSRSTMSEASRATSVPRKPIATPMSALTKAGASLTPSPIIATTAPSRWNSSISASLSSGLTRAKTRRPVVPPSAQRSCHSGSCCPVVTAEVGPAIPTASAIATAVAG